MQARIGLAAFALAVACPLAAAFAPSVQLRGSRCHAPSIGTRLAPRSLVAPTLSGGMLRSMRQGRRNVIVAQAADAGAEMTADQVIEKLLETPSYELPNVVAQNLKTVSSPSFFLRIAGMSDETKDESRKEQLSVLADNVVATLEAVMQRTEERMDGAAELVQGLIASAAEENGEFIVPLKPERVKFMRNKIALARAQIDEGILSTVFAYMKKANEDGLDGMVVIFQKLLQLWAAEELVAAGAGNAVLERLLLVDEEEWSGILAAAIEAGETDAEAMQAAVQGCVERVVLQQASGSYGQRVQAEFLRELLSRLRKEPASTDEAN